MVALALAATFAVFIAVFNVTPIRVYVKHGMLDAEIMSSTGWPADVAGMLVGSTVALMFLAAAPKMTLSCLDRIEHPWQAGSAVTVLWVALGAPSHVCFVVATLAGFLAAAAPYAWLLARMLGQSDVLVDLSFAVPDGSKNKARAKTG